MSGSGNIGGNLADLQATTTDFNQTGEDTLTAHGTSATSAENLVAEVTDVTNLLQTNFETMADDLRASITRAKNTASGADWHGQSHDNALAAEEMLNGEVNQVLEGATTAVTALRDFLVARVTDFHADVTGDFQTIMNNIDLAYRDLATATQTFAENLDLADQTIKLA